MVVGRRSRRGVRRPPWVEADARIEDEGDDDVERDHDAEHVVEHEEPARVLAAHRHIAVGDDEPVVDNGELEEGQDAWPGSGAGRLGGWQGWLGLGLGGWGAGGGVTGP